MTLKTEIRDNRLEIRVEDMCTAVHVVVVTTKEDAGDWESDGGIAAQTSTVRRRRARLTADVTNRCSAVEDALQRVW